MSDVQINTEKHLESFIKKATLIILNSRVNKEILKGNITNTSFLLKEKENFDLEYLFLDEYYVLGMPKDNIRQYTIDIFARNKKTSLLIERWKFQYTEEEPNKNNKSSILCDFIKEGNSIKYLYKKLYQLARAIYSLSRLLPGYLIKRNEIYTTEYQFYQSIKQEAFIIEPKYTIVTKNNPAMMGFTITVEYLTIKQINDYYLNLVNRQPSDYSHRHRFFSDSIKKKIPSYEVLTFDDEAQFNEGHFENDNRRRLSTEGDTKIKSKRLRIRLYEVDEFSIVDDDGDYNEDQCEKDNGNSNSDCDSISSLKKASNTINRRPLLKLTDTTGSYTSHSNDSFELTIKIDNLKPDIKQMTQKASLMKKLFKKHRYNNSNTNNGTTKWNINSLLKLVMSQCPLEGII